MAQVINFAALPTEGDPFQAALAKTIQNAMFSIPMAQEALKKEQLANAISQAKAQYAQPMEQADLALKQAQTPYTIAQTGLTNEQAKYFGPEALARIGLQGAQENQANVESKYYPLKVLADAIKSGNSTTRFGAAYQLSKALQEMSPAARASYIADHAEQYNDMVTTLGNKTLQEQENGNNANNPLTQALAKYFPEYNFNPVPSGIVPPTKQFVNNPQNVSNLQNASQLAANNYATTAATRRQLEGAVQVQNIINDPDLNMRADNASQYAGALGKGKSAIAALSQTNPKAYEDYLTFRNTDMILLQNRIKTLDQMGATDKQREELNGLYSKTMDSLTSNPAQFKQQFENLKKSLDNVARGVQKSASPIYDTNRLQQPANNNPLGLQTGGDPLRVR